MKPTLIQIDEFAPDLPAVRGTVRAQEFKTEVGPDGLEYTGINLHPVEHWRHALANALQRDIAVRLSFFRISVAGELPHNFVHQDGIISKYAGLLYMNEPKQCTGGTAFWRHAGLKIEELPTPQMLKDGEIRPDWYYRMVQRECESLDFWEQVGFVAMKENRFISYPTAMFHSRYPFEGFGETPADARLTWACFYD